MQGSEDGQACVDLHRNRFLDIRPGGGIQGSDDGQAWVDLRRHVSDTTIKMRGQFASWPVSGRAATQFYTHFRVLLLPGAGAAANSPSELALSSLELYGYICGTDSSASQRSTS